MGAIATVKKFLTFQGYIEYNLVSVGEMVPRPVNPEDSIMAKMLSVEVKVDEGMFQVSVKDGKTISRTEDFHMADLPESIAARIAIQGAPTILGQRASQIKNDPDAKLDKIVEVWSHWCETEKWEMDREGGQRLLPPIIEHFMNLTGKDAATIQRSWKKYDEKTQAKMMEEHKDAVEKIKAARLEKADDTVDLLDL